MFLVTAKDPRQGIGNHILEGLAEEHYQAIGNAVAVHVVHLGTFHNRNRRFLEVDFLPHQLVRNARARYGKERINHGRIAYHVELRIACAIRLQGIKGLHFFV